MNSTENSSPGWGQLKSQRKYWLRLAIGVVVYFLCVIALKKLAGWTELQGGTPLYDPFLAWLPVVDVTFFSDFGYKIVIACMFVYAVYYRPADAPFIFLTLGIFLLARGLLFSATVLGAPEVRFDDAPFSQVVFPFKNFYFTQDLFPSGHVGKPFVMGLLARGSGWRWFFILNAILMGILVQLNHVHYTIDIAGGFFVGYGVYRLCLLTVGRLMGYCEGEEY